MGKKQITLSQGYHRLTPSYMIGGLTAWKIKSGKKKLKGTWRFIKGNLTSSTYERLD